MKIINNPNKSGSFVCEGGGYSECFWAIYLMGRSTVGDISDRLIYNYKLKLYSSSTPNFTPPSGFQDRLKKSNFHHCGTKALKHLVIVT